MPKYKVKVKLDTCEYYEIEAPNAAMAEAEGWDKFSEAYAELYSYINGYSIDITSEFADPDDDPMQYVGHH